MVQDSITIVFGALVKPIGEQLRAQSIELAPEKIERFEKIAHAITMLYLNGMIPESMRDNARKKLMRQISNEIHKATPIGDAE